jgi:methylglyoxal synthase
MLEWARWNRELLSRAKLFATKHTGELVADDTGLRIELLLSGPQGWDPLSTQPHAADVRSLIRLAVLHDVAIACNRRSADLMISSPLLRSVAVSS